MNQTKKPANKSTNTEPTKYKRTKMKPAIGLLRRRKKARKKEGTEEESASQWQHMHTVSTRSKSCNHMNTCVLCCRNRTHCCICVWLPRYMEQVIVRLLWQREWFSVAAALANSHRDSWHLPSLCHCCELPVDVSNNTAFSAAQKQTSKISLKLFTDVI